MSRVTALFCNWEGMLGGAVQENLAGEPFLGEATTAPRYRFFSVREDSPGVVDVGTDSGGAVRGELYDVELRTLLFRFLPGEPSELELGVVELADGRAVLGMVLRPEERDRHRDITAFGGWRAYRDASR